MMPPGMDPSYLFRSPLFSDAENNNLVAAAIAAEKARAMMMMTGRPPPPPGFGPISSPMGHPGAGQLFPGAALAAALAASATGAPVPTHGLAPPPLSQPNQLSLPAPPSVTASKNGNASPPAIAIAPSKIPPVEPSSSGPLHPPTSLPQLYTLNSSRENPLPLPLPPALFSQWSAVHQAAAAHQAMIAHQANLINTSPSSTSSLATLGRSSSPTRLSSGSPNIPKTSPSSSPTLPKISSYIANSPAAPLGVSSFLQHSPSSSTGSHVASGIVGTTDIKLSRPGFPTAAALGISQRFTPYVIPPKRSTPSPNRTSPMSDQRSSPASTSGSNNNPVNGACNLGGMSQGSIRSPSISPIHVSASPARS